MDKSEPTTAGLAWRTHFRTSLNEELYAPVRDRWENSAFADSLRQFQLGESSDGRHLLYFARRFGAETGDPWLSEAIALFIEEENRHSHWLGEFLRAQGEPLLRRHWLDSVFRVIRKPLGFGLMVAVLVCAEIVAVPYYTAVRRGTRSEWLRAICHRLLRDESHHLRFQASNLGVAWRRWPMLPLFRVCHQGLMIATCAAVWHSHAVVFSAGGINFHSFLWRCLDLLDDVHAEAEVHRVATLLTAGQRA